MSDMYFGGDLPSDSLQMGPPGSFNTFGSNTSSPPIWDAPEKSHLSIDEQVKMMQSIESLFDLEENSQKEDEVMVDSDDAELPAVDLEDQRRRTEKLRGAMSTLEQLWWTESQYMDVVVEKLADASRDPKWRIPLGDSGIVTFFLEIFSQHSLRHAMSLHALRLIGNSCADTDENRARVLSSNSLPAIIVHLRDTSLIPFTIPVLYNICVDYEPAQQQACQLFLTRELIDLISSPRFEDSMAFIGYVCKILDLMLAQTAEPELAPDNAPVVLLQIAAVTNKKYAVADLDDFVALVTTACSYLSHERFQKALIAHGAVDNTLAVLVDSYTRFDSIPSVEVPDEDSAKAILELRNSLNQVLSDVSALPEFKAAYPVISPLTSSLRRWLSSPLLQLQVCACIMLGNLARSDQACEEFVQVCRVHTPLIAVLKDTKDSQLLHAAIGFLKNLALPAKNKGPIGASGIFEVLPRLWALDTLQQIQFSSISLARQLTIGTFDNVKQVCSRLTQDGDSPANSRTNLSLLIALFERTDVEPIKMEIARLVTSVCRVFETITTERTPEQLHKIRVKFFRMHPDVGRPLSFMVSQTKWPVVRSEGWFVFALLSRYPEGAQCISDLMHDVSVFGPLVELLTGKDILIDGYPHPLLPPTDNTTSDSSPSTTSTAATSPPAVSPASFETRIPQPEAQAAEMARIDRENAVVLVSELLKNRGKEMAIMRRAMFEDLLKGGSELIMSYREQAPAWGGERIPRDKRLVAGLKMHEVISNSFEEFQ